MIVHSYLTDGFFPWAKLFVKSFRFHNGSDCKIVLTTRDLNKKQVDVLYSMSDNIEIINKPLNINRMSKLSGISKKKLTIYKDQVERKHVTRQNKIWKQFISVEDRYRNSIREAVDRNPEEDFLLHFDIDMYVRKPLDDLFDIVRSNDISIRFRLKSAKNRKVMGGLIGFKLGKPFDVFMSQWIHHIDAIDIKKKPMGYGQTSFYLAYKDLKSKYNWGDIPLKYISSSMKDDDVVWSANNMRGKTKNLEICKTDFKNIKER